MTTLLLLLLCCLWYHPVNVAGFPPPIRPLAEVGDAARSLLEHGSVSTELTLGQSNTANAQHEAAYWQHWTSTPAPSPPIPVSIDPAAVGRSAFSSYRDHRLAPNRAQLDLGPSPSTASSNTAPIHDNWIAPYGPSFFDIADAPLTARPWQEGQGVVPHVQLDPFFGDELLVAGAQALWKLPDVVIGTTSSSRFDAAYFSFVGFRPGKRKRFWKAPVKTPMQENEVEAIVRNLGRLFTTRVTAYKVRFEEPLQEPVEVLVRYFSDDIRSEQLGIRENSIAVFQSSNKGSRLAFLGIYHCPRQQYDKMVRLERTQPLKVQRSDVTGIFLTPQSRSA
ncbi:uncharacterized protein SRS1_10315 [Sporisorium reilianum f. sp. reilianum]|uniref:Effector family protein Eff1 n=1 Tax=Sporisorium reilianum f. sp. reilianum TaxID=72559 RepID=A0A2N8U9G1_9BASI|nr:uncharacterized protein SRS1_10315 [Sporisorium reilianum f. sp. reilianum]